MKHLLAAVLAVALVAVGASAALGNPPEPPKFTICHHPPGNPENAQTIEVGSLAALLAHLKHGDTRGACSPGGPNGPPSPNSRVLVADEPAGENCPAGGVKITLVNGRLDRPDLPDYQPEPEPVLQGVTTGETTPEIPRPPRPPDPEDEVFYVCNGEPGVQGPPGPPGPAGPSGPSIAGPAPVTGKACLSSVRLGLRFFLPSRFDGRRVLLRIQGPNTINTRFLGSVPVKTTTFGQRPAGRFIFVPMRNRNCGRYILTLSQPGAGPALVGVWTITGRFGLTRTRIA